MVFHHFLVWFEVDTPSFLPSFKRERRAPPADADRDSHFVSWSEFCWCAWFSSAPPVHFNNCSLLTSRLLPARFWYNWCLVLQEPFLFSFRSRIHLWKWFDFFNYSTIIHFSLKCVQVLVLLEFSWFCHFTTTNLEVFSVLCERPTQSRA